MNGWTRIAVGAALFFAGVVSVVVAHGDPSTVGVQQWGLVAAILGGPAIGAFVTTTLDRSRPRFAAHALVPAGSTYAGIVAGSLLFGGWALNWLWISIFWSIAAATVGLLAGRFVLARRKSKRAPP